MLVNLSDTDREIIQATFNIADGIAMMNGKQTEVVVHSLDIENPSIVKIVNGHVTGRSVGAPITNLAIEKLISGTNVSEPYYTRSSEGKLLRSITTIVSNQAGTPIALLCVNSDMDMSMQDYIGSLLPAGISFDAIAETPEVFATSADDMLSSSIKRISAKADSMKLSRAKRTREILQNMYNEGLFNVKDAVQIAAKEIGTSTDTVYRYIRQFKNN